MNIKQIVDNFEPFRDTSPRHIHDGHGSFCGKGHGDFTRGIDWRDVVPEKLLLADTCAQCWSAWKYMKEHD